MRIELCEEFRAPELFAAACGARLCRVGAPAREVRFAATDTREIGKGDLFLALDGKHVRGADFAAEALARGAAGLLMPADAVAPSGNYLLFSVGDTGAALLAACAVRRAVTPAFTIAVSGSCGKTTFKEALAAILSQTGTTAVTPGNRNSAIGMPLSVLAAPRTRFGVFEIGINGAGEMAALSAALSPDLAVLTNVGTAHLGGFGDALTLRTEKLRIGEGVPRGGTLLLPENLRKYADFKSISVKTFGTDATADFRAENIHNSENGVTLDLKSEERIITNLAWYVPGSVGVGVLSAVGAAAILCGASEAAIRTGIASASANQPRMRCVPCGARLLIDDTYNASPEAMAAALDALRLLAGKRPRVAVLGDMLELGEASPELHDAVGEFAAGSGVCALFTYGRRSLAVAGGAMRGGLRAERVFAFGEGEEEALARRILLESPRNAVILFKASRAMALERVFQKVKEGAE